MANPVHYHLGGFPPENIDWKSLIPLIGPANAAIARYDGMLAAIPNPDILIAPLTTREAVLSSKIEGTQATMGEVYKYEAEGESAKYSEKKRDDIFEIINYRRALNHAVNQLKVLPLSQRLLKDSHKILLSGVRGHSKAPGEYRRLANFIGKPGSKIEEAEFIPISAELLPDAMSTWEKYIHEDAPDLLVQLAILHAEFESLHPFLDGNGRLGRMMVPLFLYSKNALIRPMFYLSAYLESNRDEYYDRLRAISRDRDWTGWCRFFLNAVVIQAQENLDKTRAILELYDRKKIVITEATHSQHAIKALDFLFSNPIFSSSRFLNNADIPAPSAKRILKVLKQNDILRTLSKSGGSKPATLLFWKLFNIVEDRPAY